MVAIAPFRALRYNADLVGSLSRVIAPPYDVISPREQDELYDASAYNVVRLIYGKQFPDDTEYANRYTRATATFEEWCRRRILVRDETPALYLVEHAFAWQGQAFRRLGFIALLEFHGSVPEQVLRHEATFEAPKTDRSRLLEAVRANLSPVFCIAPDPQQRVSPLLKQVTQAQRPLAAARYRDEQIRLWAITDPERIQTVREQLAGASVLIADGHHRFDVAFAKRHLFGAVMSYFALLEDPALVIRPIHRVVHIAPEARDAWRERLKTLCTLESAPSLEHVTRWLATGQGHGRFGYYEQGCCSTVTLREDVLATWLLRASVPLALAGLDVTVLHEVMLPRLLGPACAAAGGAAGRTSGPPRASEGGPPGANHLCRYTPDPAQAIEMAQQEGDCAWLLRAIPLPQVFALAAQGFTLPQKSTYFYPKVLSGLCINPFDA